MALAFYRSTLAMARMIVGSEKMNTVTIFASSKEMTFWSYVHKAVSLMYANVLAHISSATQEVASLSRSYVTTFLIVVMPVMS
jgi:hypothetical protein